MYRRNSKKIYSFDGEKCVRFQCGKLIFQCEWILILIHSMKFYTLTPIAWPDHSQNEFVATIRMIVRGSTKIHKKGRTLFNIDFCFRIYGARWRIYVKRICNLHTRYVMLLVFLLFRFQQWWRRRCSFILVEFIYKNLDFNYVANMMKSYF